MAKVLASLQIKRNYLTTIFTSSSLDKAPENSECSLRSSVKISEITLTTDEVRDCLSKLDVTKATGPDGIPARILRECSSQIASSLCALFNYSLRTGCFPSDWKCADVTPVHKRDSKEPASKYRPISLLSIISKVMERCVCNRLHEHFSQLITSLQHGFVRNRSCVTQLLAVLHKIGEALDKNKQSDILYLDFAKAFDCVDYTILIEKLRWYGIDGCLLEWFKDYLKGRYQRVIVDGVASQPLPVTSGVPQGSLVGPLLFTIFINDLPEAVDKDSGIALYADDTKLHRTIMSVEDCEQLQRDLIRAEKWSHESNMKFNTNKCKALTVTRKKSPLVYNYHLGDTSLLCVNEEKDLGVVIANNLKWDSHVNGIVSKANRMLGLLKRSCPLLRDTQVRRTLYLSLVKSQVCFASEVWSPSVVGLRRLLERVQRRATRWILKERTGDTPYKDRLRRLHLLPLTYDREIRDLVFLYKCINGQTNLNLNNFVTFISHGRSRAKNPSLILKPAYCRTSTYQASFFNRIVKPWNYICKYFSPDKFSSLAVFKYSLQILYFDLLNSTYNIDFPCTWHLCRDCACHRN